MCTLALCLGFDWPGRAARLAADLDAAGPRERREIVRLLAATGSEEARPAILKACGDADAIVRREALRAAGRIGAQEAAPTLLQALSDPDPALRATAAEALGNLTVKEAAQPLTRALADSEGSVRRAAVIALSALPGNTQLPALITALDDVDTEVRLAAVQHLALGSSERARDALLGKTRDASPEVRAAALEAVAKGNDPRAALALSQALDDSADVVVLAALRGLRHINGVDLRALVAPLTRSARARVAAAAQLALAQRTAEPSEVLSPAGSTTPAWLPWLERTADRNADPKQTIAGLERTLPEGENLAFDPLLLYLPQVPQSLRARVVALMGRSHSKGAAPHLVKLLDDQDSAVRSAAAAALANVGAKSSVAALERLLADDHAAVRASAAHAVGVLADGAEFRALLQLLDVSSDREANQRAAVLTAFADGLRRVRRDLQATDQARLLSVLKAELTHPDAERAVEAARGLGELGSPAAVAILSSLSARAPVGLRVAAVRALLRADASSALPALRSLANDASVAVRATAIAALGLVGNAGDVPAIEQAERNGPWPLGPVATFALSSLVLRAQTHSDALCKLMNAKEPRTRENARAGLHFMPSTQCPSLARANATAGYGTQEPPSATWRALVLSDGRVLISHPDALGRVTFPNITSVRSESPWRLPYGVHH